MTSEFTLNEAQQGPPGYTHGGASASVLDEAMGLVVWAAGHKVAAVNCRRERTQDLRRRTKAI